MHTFSKMLFAQNLGDCVFSDVLDTSSLQQGSKYRISGSYQMGVFISDIGYRGRSGIPAHIGRSYRTLYIM